MLIGLVGKPSTGKSTLFNALTHGSAEVANYPFTTINPNEGVAFVKTDCACKALGVECEPRAGACANGRRGVPVNVADVAGLVEGAHEGRGRGNQFLNDLNAADALICVADASGATDAEGNPCPPGSHDAAEDVSTVLNELDYWFAGVLEKNCSAARGKTFQEFAQGLTGLRVTKQMLDEALDELEYWPKPLEWTAEQRLEIARKTRQKAKPFIIAANKCDSRHAPQNLERLREAYPEERVVPCSADSELALQRAKEKGIVEYSGEGGFTVAGGVPEQLGNALEKIRERVITPYGSTGTSELLGAAVFGLFNKITVFPVEDETHYSDNFGRVLPDAVLLDEGATALDLAAKVHTDLAKGFLYGVDCKTRMRLGKEHALKNGDVVRVVAVKK